MSSLESRRVKVEQGPQPGRGWLVLGIQFSGSKLLISQRLWTSSCFSLVLSYSFCVIVSWAELDVSSICGSFTRGLLQGGKSQTSTQSLCRITARWPAPAHFSLRVHHSIPHHHSVKLSLKLTARLRRWPWEKWMGTILKQRAHGWVRFWICFWTSSMVAAWRSSHSRSWKSWTNILVFLRGFVCPIPRISWSSILWVDCIVITSLGGESWSSIWSTDCSSNTSLRGELWGVARSSIYFKGIKQITDHVIIIRLSPWRELAEYRWTATTVVPAFSDALLLDVLLSTVRFRCQSLTFFLSFGHLPQDFLIF